MREGIPPAVWVSQCPRLGALRKLSRDLGVPAFQVLCDKHRDGLPPQGYIVETVSTVEAMALRMDVTGQCEARGHFKVQKACNDGKQSGTQVDIDIKNESR